MFHEMLFFVLIALSKRDYCCPVFVIKLLIIKKIRSINYTDHISYTAYNSARLRRKEMLSVNYIFSVCHQNQVLIVRVKF